MDHDIAAKYLNAGKGASCDDPKPMVAPHDDERRYTKAVRNAGCGTTRHERQRQSCARQRGMDWTRIQCWLSYTISELVGTFFLGVFAVGSSDIAATFGGGALNAFAYGATFAITVFGLALMFGQFGAGHYNPAFTLMAWLCDRDPFNINSFVRYISMWLAQFGGFVLAALFVNAYVGGSAPLGCTNVNAAQSQGLAFVVEFLGLLFLLHIFVLAGMRRKGGPLTTYAIGTGLGLLVAVFGSSSGGSFNMFRTIGVGLVEGCLAGDIWIYIVSWAAAPIITALLVSYVFPPHCGNQLPKVIVAETCNTEPENDKQC